MEEASVAHLAAQAIEDWKVHGSNPGLGEREYFTIVHSIPCRLLSCGF